MTTLAELKVKAENLGLDRGIVRLYGDLRKIETWEKAIISHKTVTVEAVEIADTVAEEVTKNEIIAFEGDRLQGLLEKAALLNILLEKYYGPEFSFVRKNNNVIFSTLESLGKLTLRESDGKYCLYNLQDFSNFAKAPKDMIAKALKRCGIKDMSRPENWKEGDRVYFSGSFPRCKPVQRYEGKIIRINRDRFKTDITFDIYCGDEEYLFTNASADDITLYPPTLEIKVDEVEIADTVAEEIDKAEIIPFIPEIDLAECNDRKSTMLLELARQRAIFEKKQAIADCPPPPPPAPIVRPCPIPESPSIPGVEIAKENKDDPTIPGSDRRVTDDHNTRNVARMIGRIYNSPDTSKNLSEQLLDQCKTDIQRYFEWLKEDTEYCFEVNYLDEQLNNSLNELIDFLSSDISKKTSIYDIWATVPHFKREGFYKLIPFALHEIYTSGNPPIDFWECTRETVWLLIEKPAPIPLLAEDFGGVFIPNRLHELGLYKYLWKFPGAIQCENFFHGITDAKEYAIIPANKPITTSELVLAGV